MQFIRKNSPVTVVKAAENWTPNEIELLCTLPDTQVHRNLFVDPEIVVLTGTWNPSALTVVLSGTRKVVEDEDVFYTTSTSGDLPFHLSLETLVGLEVEA